MSASEAIACGDRSVQPTRWSPGNASKDHLSESPQGAGNPRGGFVQFRNKLGRVHEGNTGAAPKSFRKFANRPLRCLDAAARRSYHVAVKQPSLLATRRSLVERLADWGDQLRWQEFFDTYSKLIYSAARKSGLTDAESQEVVQETVITVAKSIDKLKYDPAIGSFKGWLLQITRWRIADQFRKREPGNARRAPLSDDRATATIERVPDSRSVDLDAVWETQWKENLFAAAIARVKKQIEPKQFQIFDCYVRKEWPAQKVAARLGVNIGQVYLTRHRVGALLKKEIKALEKRGC